MKIKRLLSVFIVLLTICFLPDLAIWLHQTLVFGRHPLAFLVFLFITILVLIPFFIKWFRWLIGHSFAENDWEPVILFATGGLCWIIAYWNYGNATIDFHFHDTYYIMSPFRLWQYILLIFGFFCVIYFLVPVVFKRHLNIKLSRIHFWLTHISLSIIVGTKSTYHVLGPRRYYEYVGWNAFDQIQLLNIFTSVVLMLVTIAQLLFLFNVMFAFFRERKS